MIVPYQFATPVYAQAIELRQAVLRAPLGMSIANDPLEEEHDQLHFGAFIGDDLVGTATLQAVDGKLKMRQVAVAKAGQHKGVGRALVKACEVEAKRQNTEKLYCHARAEARIFYEKCGWVVSGEVFTEVGIDHYLMVAPIG